MFNGLRRTRGFVFPAADRPGPLSTETLYVSWRLIRREAGLGGLRLHDLRHTYASLALQGGESVVMITGTARMSSSFEVSQSVSNVAEVKFKLTVVDMPLMLTLMAPDNVMDGNVVEGQTYDLVVSANRMITEAEGSVEVTLMRDRSQSDADDSDFTVGSATIMAGYDSATAELMVTEDMEPDSGTNDNMGEQLVLYGMAGDLKTNDLTLTIWDQAVPALPLIGQLVLALFLALGGARLYRRRQG